ncbi:Mpp10 protein [Aureobasidium sp. EXF-12298]|nr:Mpp10 protein [Aureobasidium sp. EXF-12298]KAI4759416.1 Mpp10 protein [Aureobasidium sp. EXF-12344]KAI4777444.1 Mpp10 protein [Aureobasidium sp. EXF-3400]
MAAILVKSLTSEPYTFLQPPTTLHTSSLDFLKQTLDPIAKSIAETQQQRLQEARKKRKRGQNDEDEEILRLKKVHVEGFAVEQVWEQARRIIDAARQEAQRNFDELAEKYAIDDSEDESESQDGEGLSEEGESDIGEEGVDYEVEGEDVDGEEEDDDEEMDVDGEVDDFEESYIEADEDVAMGSEGEFEAESEEAAEYIPDPHGLNDGFFSIDDFNKQSEFLEQADARGDNDFDDDDEEGIDWGSNPLGASATISKAAQDDDDESDDEDGPTFGNVDLNAPEGFSDNEEEVEEGEMDGMGSLSNTNDVKYADFFAPPAKKARKNKKGRPNPHNFPAKQASPSGADEPAEDDEEMERTMEKVHRDLFDDVTDDEEDEENLDPADPRSRRSAHERRQAALTEEIRRLEAANVAKRDWTLSGEARAADRPVNSLLEEDLEFERVGKPVPVITAEISESLEELIKRRILAEDFQDIIRRRPDDLATGNSSRRGRLDFELDDSKSKKSLAEMYEEEHLKATDPNYVDAKDEKAQKEQREIDALWRDISNKLDSLSSWHFKPKGPATQLDIRVDAPVVRLEDARPTAGAEAAAASQLAPQEIYKAGEAAEKAEAEIATRGGLVVNREEMSREERKRRRRRDKEREKKSLANVDPSKKESKKTKERKGIISDLKKGGVKVIGNKGQITDVSGAAVKDAKAPSAGGSYKL